MLCRRCQYTLIGLAAGPCPECGRSFDPADSRSFLRRRRIRLPAAIGVVLALQIAVVSILLALARGLNLFFFG